MEDNEELYDAAMEKIAIEVMTKTFGSGPFPSTLNQYLAPKIVELYFEERDDAQSAIGNLLWMNYSGGDTCHNAAKEIINGWKAANLI